MQRYIAVRVFQAAITLLILSLAVFLSVHLTGDPALYLIGPEATDADYEQIKKNMGLDRPLYVQYVSFLGNIVRADFGKSHIRGVPAREILLQRLPATLQYRPQLVDCRNWATVTGEGSRIFCGQLVKINRATAV